MRYRIWGCIAHILIYRTFLDDFGSQLLDIEDALDEWLGEAWDFNYDPIALSVRTGSGTSCLITVCTYLCGV